MIDINKIDNKESRKLLLQNFQNKQLIKNKNNTTKLLKLFINLLLVIIQAAAYLNTKTSTITQYLKIYKKSNNNIIKLLNKDFEDIRRYSDIKNPVTII
jgi:ABC-type siderophore export system fused ATPase/permease subunit